MPKQWSRSRPVKPDTDPLFIQVKRLIDSDPRSVWAKANVSGLSPATINAWMRGKTKHPQGVSLQMAAKMLGKRIVLEDK